MHRRCCVSGPLERGSCAAATKNLKRGVSTPKSRLSAPGVPIWWAMHRDFKLICSTDWP